MSAKETLPGVTYRDHLVGFALAAAYLALLLATAPALGMARDEGTYVIAANRYAEWFELLGTDRIAALAPPAIDQRWEFNHEHPGLIKSFFSLSVLADRKLHLFTTPSQAYRLPGMVTGALLLWLVYIFGARTVGRQAGMIGALALALMPQYFYHAHLACFDVPIAFFLTLVVYAYFRSLTDARWSILVGLTYGLALATKHNAWILPGVLLIHFVWMSIAETFRRRRTKRSTISTVPYWLFAMIALGPLVFVGTWPWLWQNTRDRVEEYARFHLHHDFYNMAYFGLNYYRPPFPISYPFVMTLFTVPVTTLVLLGFALIARLPTYMPWPFGRFFRPEGLKRRDVLRTDVLFVGCMLAPLVVIALPSTPIFGGTKHWMPAYPFLALYAGWAGRRVIRRLRAIIRPLAPRGEALLAPGVALILLAPSFVETAHSHPFGLAHYTWAAGFTPGAADHGMNRQFWGYTTGSLGPFFARHLPHSGSIWICDTMPEAFEQLKRDHVLAEDARIAWTMAEADFAIVHHEHHFAEVDGQLWVAFGVEPVFVLTHDGVPIISVYENPTRRALHRWGPAR